MHSRHILLCYLGIKQSYKPLRGNLEVFRARLELWWEKLELSRAVPASSHAQRRRMRSSQVTSHSFWSTQRENSALLTLQLRSKHPPGAELWVPLSWFLKLGEEAGFGLHSVIVFNGTAPCRHSRRGELHLNYICFSPVKGIKGDWFRGILPDKSPGAAACEQSSAAGESAGSWPYKKDNLN